MNNIDCETLVLGKDTFVSPSAKISGLNGPAKRVVIGDFCYIGDDVHIICDDFELGDYSKIHRGSSIHGYKPCKIGHNAWIGQFTIIDSIGRTTIGNNFGVGANSQLWSHIKYGDTLEGCRFLSESPLTIGNDVWLVGHCIVSPVNIEDKVMCLVGSVITKNLSYNRIYAGSPVQDITDKIGNQFEPVSVNEKYNRLVELYRNFSIEVGGKNIKIIKSESEINWEDDVSYFNVSDRTYTKKYNIDEIQFMKYLLPEKAKFIPLNRRNINVT
jgi:acetyltransferase-like isoleucine patch superfamily enzyme